MPFMASLCDYASNGPRIVRFGGLLEFVGGTLGRLMIVDVLVVVALHGASSCRSWRWRSERLIDIMPQLVC